LYDGPPFATAQQPYGHILAGAITDTVTRWAYQTGHHVERRFGWGKKTFLSFNFHLIQIFFA